MGLEFNTSRGEMPPKLLLFHYVVQFVGDFLRRRSCQTLKSQSPCLFRFTTLEGQGGSASEQDGTRRFRLKFLKETVRRFTLQFQGAAHQLRHLGFLALQTGDP